MGSIHLATGPMFSGKTTWLIDNLQKSNANETIAIKYFLDNRYAIDNIKTHDGKSIKAKNAKNESDILKLLKENPHIKILGIDEIHFFNPTISKFLNELKNKNLTIYTVGLNIDYKNREWETVIKVSEIADSKKLFKAICSTCGKRNATKIHRKTADKKRVLIGGADMYESLCEIDYFKLPLPESNL